MKVAAITYSNNRYFYNKKETSVTTTKSQIVTDEIEIIQSTEDDTYNTNTNTQRNSAEYVKHAYEVSFRPLDMILNLQ